MGEIPVFSLRTLEVRAASDLEEETSVPPEPLILLRALSMARKELTYNFVRRNSTPRKTRVVGSVTKVISATVEHALVP